MKTQTSLEFIQESEGMLSGIVFNQNIVENASGFYLTLLAPVCLRGNGDLSAVQRDVATQSIIFIGECIAPMFVSSSLSVVLPGQ